MGKKPSSRKFRYVPAVSARLRGFWFPILAVLAFISNLVLYQNCSPAKLKGEATTSASSAASSPNDVPAGPGDNVPPTNNELKIEVSHPNLDFGKVAIGTTQARILKITNRTASDSIQISAQISGADFVMDPNSSCFKQPIASGGTCQVTLFFSAKATTALNSTISFTVVKAQDTAQRLIQTVVLAASGFNLTPSVYEMPFSVGWFVRKDSPKVSFVTRTASNAACPALILPTDGSALNPYSGQQREFCFEPSGANGLQLATTPADLDAAGNRMRDYILQSGIAATPVVLLDSIFANVADRTTTTVHLKEGLFQYTLNYFYVPRALPSQSIFDMRYLVHHIDDAVGVIVNNRFAGYVNIVETWGTRAMVDPVTGVSYSDYPDKNFPVSLRYGKDNSLTINPSPWGTTPGYGKNNLFSASPLVAGVNTVMTVMLDDGATLRMVLGAKYQYKSINTLGEWADLQVLAPGVVQGYVNDKISGATVSGAIVRVTDPSTGQILKETTTDANGFYRISGISNGARNVVFSWNGITEMNEITVDHKIPTQAIIEVHRGL